MVTPVYHINMSMKNEYPKLPSPGVIGNKLQPPVCSPAVRLSHLLQNMTFHYISRSIRDKILNFSGNNYDGVWNITLKNNDDHSIQMGV